MEFNGERFVPGVHGLIELEHLHRYLQACRIAEGKVILDIASGEGYGSAMLAAHANKVIGVDISQEAIEHAQSKYRRSNLEFRVGSCADIPLTNDSVDLVISFETLEHHDQHERMMEEVKRVLKPRGILLISCPDKLHYTVEPGRLNPFHVKELFKHEFEDLLSKHFKKTGYYAQRVLYGSGIFASQTSAPLNSYVLSKDIVKEFSGLSDPSYWIALASDFPLPDLTSSVLEQPIDESEVLLGLKKSSSEYQQHVAQLNEGISRANTQNSALNQGILDRDGQIHNLSHGVIHRDAQIASLNQSLTDRSAQIASLNQGLTERESKIASMYQDLAERDAQIQILNHRVNDRETQVAGLKQELGERDSQLAVAGQKLTKRAIQIASLNHHAADQENRISGLHQRLSDRDDQVSESQIRLTGLIQRAIDREAQIANIGQQRIDYEAQLENLTRRVSDCNSEMAQLQQTLSERDAQIANLNLQVEESDAQIAALTQSLSGRGTPFAGGRTAFQRYDKGAVELRQSETKRGKGAFESAEARERWQDSLLRAASFTPLSLNFPNAWVGHLPFGAWLIETLAPGIFVELGTHTGNSFFTFCQAVVQSGVQTRCYAVDTWQGDEHAGEYDESIFNRVNAHQQQHYREFSRLLRMRFEDALKYFSNGSISLLHVDGLHTYEAVKADFESWLPKLAPGAVVLFHDTNVRERNFGVWKLWEELKVTYPRNLEFVHSHGLGLLQLNNPPEHSQLPWLEPHSAEKQKIVDYFSSLGSRHLDLAEAIELREHVSNISRICDGKDEHIIYRDGQIASLNHGIAERDREIANLNSVLTERNSRVAGLAAAVTERNSQVVGLNHALAQRNNQIATLAATVHERDSQFSQLTGAMALRDEQFAQITSSRSWRLTSPMRLIIKSMRSTPSARRVANGNGAGTQGTAVVAVEHLSDPVLGVNGHDQPNRNSEPYLSLPDHLDSIVQSVQPLFDAEWYLQKNSDVLAAGVIPLEHFLHDGWKEGRNPHPLFDVRYYLDANPDVRDSGINPLQHFLESGGKEGRNPHPMFDAAWYLENYPDVRAAGVNPLLHFLENGWKEGRWPNRGFNLPWYIDTYADVRNSGMNPLVHYVEFGSAEGRQILAAESKPAKETIAVSVPVPEQPIPASPVIDKPRDPSSAAASAEPSQNASSGDELSLDITEYLPRGRRTQTVPSGLEVDIIIPVYRGYEETRRCLMSVLADSDRPGGDILVIDDCSPDPQLSHWLSTLAATGTIKLTRNAENMGFVRTVNNGMAAAGRRDVVLLNSDTEVPAGFVRRLADHAYSKSDVATVTPFSNAAGEMTGFPDKVCRPLPPTYSTTEIDNACQEANGGKTVEIPIGVGFCLYIRRECLDDIGLFDAEAFGRGYGEETDFCRRAKARGWHHLLACDTFVYHIGEVSFGQNVPERASSWNTLVGRHPDLPAVLGSYLAGKPTVPPVFAATASLFQGSPLPTVAILNHGFDDGNSRLTDSLTADLMGSANVLVLRAHNSQLEVTVPSIPGHPVLKVPEAASVQIAKYLHACGVSRVHIHHWIGIGPALHKLVDNLNIPVDLTVHDHVSA